MRSYEIFPSPGRSALVLSRHTASALARSLAALLLRCPSSPWSDPMAPTIETRQRRSGDSSCRQMHRALTRLFIACAYVLPGGGNDDRSLALFLAAGANLETDFSTPLHCAVGVEMSDLLSLLGVNVDHDNQIKEWRRCTFSLLQGLPPSIVLPAAGADMDPCGGRTPCA